MKSLKLKDILALTELPSEKQNFDTIKTISDNMYPLWRYPDYNFGVYKAADYIYELIYCYFYVSKGSMNGSMTFIETTYTDSNISILDDYNGCGLTTLHLLTSKFNNIFIRNDNQLQLDFFNKVLKQQNIEKSYNLYTNEDYLFDVIVSLEVVEHYKDPLEYLKFVKEHLKIGGHFIYTQGFSWKGIGHFDTYTFNGEEVSNKKAHREFLKYLRQNFECVKKYYNGKPMVYRRIS